MKACAICGSQIFAVGNRQYCENCMRRACEQCGTIYFVRQVTQISKHCSQACYDASKKGKPALNRNESNYHPCLRCGKITRNSKYCSWACRGPKAWKHKDRGTGLGLKHRHHIVPLHDGGLDEETNLTPPISIRLHAMFHYDRWKALGQMPDFVAWRMLVGQMTATEAAKFAQQEGCRKGGLACRGTPKTYKTGKNIPWNKGKYNIYSDETLARMSASARARRNGAS